MNLLDNGVGVFQKLQRAFNFQDMREGILNLSKGKFTTDSKNHTGEGIFLLHARLICSSYQPMGCVI